MFDHYGDNEQEPRPGVKVHIKTTDGDEHVFEGVLTIKATSTFCLIGFVNDEDTDEPLWVEPETITFTRG